jgi:hypothetical protein
MSAWGAAAGGGAHADDAAASDDELRSRWRLHAASRRISAATALVAAAHCAAMAALSAADAWYAPELQASKEWACVIASLPAAAAAAACAASRGLAGAWPQAWWLAHGRAVLAIVRALAALAAPALQRVAFALLVAGPQPVPFATAWRFLITLAPALQAAALAAALCDVCAEHAGALRVADAFALVASAALLRAHPSAVASAALGAAAAAALRAALSHTRPAPAPGALAAWQAEQEQKEAEDAAFLASCVPRRFLQVRITMALAGALCAAVTARGGLAGWHAAYNALAAACMLATAALPAPLLSLLFRAWPSLWTAVCVAMLPFHVFSEQCARGYALAPGASCARLATGALDGSSLLPFVVHVAVGPALRLPGGTCYLFLLLPVAGFIAMELPHLTAFSAVERIELASGLLVSAALSAHGVLCCDAAERDAHEQRARLGAEKANTRKFTSYILHEVRVPFAVVRMGIDHVAACVASRALAPADRATRDGVQEVLCAMVTSADAMTRCVLTWHACARKGEMRASPPVLGFCADASACIRPRTAS